MSAKQVIKISGAESSLFPGNMDTYQVLKAAHVLRAINHPLRQKMIQYIHHSGKANVTQIYIKLRLEQSVASQHLAILRKAGFVKTERSGKQIYYSIDYDKLTQVEDLSKQLLSGK